MKSESDMGARMWDVDHSKEENLEDFCFFLQLEDFHNTHMSLTKKKYITGTPSHMHCICRCPFNVFSSKVVAVAIVVV